MVIKAIHLDSAEPLEVIEFKLKGSTLTSYNCFSREKCKRGKFFTFMQVLRDFLIPSTSKHLLWKRWEMANPYNEERHMWIKKFSNWLTELQLKFIDKKGKQSISEQVKRRKSWNYLPQCIAAALIPHVKEDWTSKNLVQWAEFYPRSKQHIPLSTTTMRTSRQISTKPHNPDRNRLRNARQLQKTGFYHSKNNYSNQLAKSHPSNNPE